MSRPVTPLLTDRESEIMQVLWARGEATSEEVRMALPDRPHDSTVRTLLRILKEKGYVRVSGRQPAIYEPAIERTAVQTKAARSLLARFFGGSVESLVLRLVDDEQLSPEEIDQLRRLLADHKRKRKGST